MLTIDEYIAKMKKADKIDEFDLLKQSENMTAVIKYVMSYFNEYLTHGGLRCRNNQTKAYYGQT